MDRQDRSNAPGLNHAHIMSLYALGVNLLDVIREGQRDVLNHLQVILYHVRFRTHVYALNDANDRLLAAQRNLEDSLNEFHRLCDLLDQIHAPV